MGKYFSVAIDGPSGAGKSTIAKMCAEKFGFLYIDTGAIYRTVGVATRNAGLGSRDEAGVVSLLPDIEISMCHDENGLQRMILNGRDVTDEIRLPEISIYASDVSAMPAVRSFLLDKQREFARTSNVIMDGRDIGTVVLPDADLKIFLTATSEERALRRFEELRLRGTETSYEEVLRDIRYRDSNDSTRSAAPLRPAEGAVILDTTGNSLTQSFEMICVLIEEKFER
ncbi:MAG: (d)CMP kinase [Oscillospiraceae bacterium]|nr:(d)CMP kinase [Oscillospiraceae bacterium]